MSRRDRTEDDEEEDNDFETAFARAMQQYAVGAQDKETLVYDEEDEEEDDNSTYDDDGEDERPAAAAAAADSHRLARWYPPSLPAPQSLQEMTAQFEMPESVIPADASLLSDVRSFGFFYSAAPLEMYPDSNTSAVRNRSHWRNQMLIPWPYRSGVPAQEEVYGPAFPPADDAKYTLPKGARHEQLVYMQWDDARLPKQGRYHQIHEYWWRQVENIVQRGLTSMDWSNSIYAMQELQEKRGNPNVEAHQKLPYNASRIFDVPSYSTAVSEVLVQRRDLTTVVQSVDLRHGDYFDDPFGGVMTFGISGTRFTPLQVVYISRPVMPGDVSLDDAAIRTNKPNREVDHQSYISLVAPLENARQKYIASVNKVLISGLMETAILYGPTMAVSRGAFDTDPSVRHLGPLFLKYWQYGTVWSAKDDMLVDSTDDAVELRRKSIWLISENWRRARLAALYSMYKNALTQRRADGTTLADCIGRLSSGARARKLTPNGRAAYCALLPYTWSVTARTASQDLRHDLQADHYRPVAAHTLDGGENMVYNDRDRTAEASVYSRSALQSAETLCAIISTQAAVSTFGGTPQFPNLNVNQQYTGFRVDVINYDRFMAQVFGHDIIDVRRVYKEDLVMDTAMAADLESDAVDFAEAVREVMRLLTLNAFPGDTYSLAMYRQMFGPERVQPYAVPGDTMLRGQPDVNETEVAAIFA